MSMSFSSIVSTFLDGAPMTSYISIISLGFPISPADFHPSTPAHHLRPCRCRSCAAPARPGPCPATARSSSWWGAWRRCWCCPGARECEEDRSGLCGCYLRNNFLDDFVCRAFWWDWALDVNNLSCQKLGSWDVNS